MINIFSYKNIKAHISLNGVNPDEYYISILSTGGVNGIPIFENISNVCTMIFDDVTYDCLKTQYPDGNGLRWAKAMTERQADSLCKFVKQIPTDVTINIHCAWGHSRSKAIAAAIENATSTTGNKLVYKLIKERLHK
jgi:predicted protein tyrosine phosphatase